MQKRKEPEKLQLLISGLQQKGCMLRMFELSFTVQTITRLLLPRDHRKNLRPQLQGLRKGLETIIKNLPVKPDSFKNERHRQ
jgi:hypothetical protein